MSRRSPAKPWQRKERALSDEILKERDRYLNALRLIHAYYREPASVFNSLAKETGFHLEDDENCDSIWNFVEQALATKGATE